MKKDVSDMDNTFSYEQAYKDALLEWANGKMTEDEQTEEGFIGGYNYALKEVIDKLNNF